MNLKLYIFLLIILTFFSCTLPQEKSNIIRLEWLEGTWLYASTNTDSIYEEWHLLDNHILFGTNYTINNKIKTINETIKVYEENDIILYCPKVYAQNNGDEIQFKMDSLSEKYLRVQNLNHSYPQYIEYRHIHKDTIHAMISGSYNNQYKEFKFIFIRQPF